MEVPGSRIILDHSQSTVLFASAVVYTARREDRQVDPADGSLIILILALTDLVNNGLTHGQPRVEVLLASSLWLELQSLVGDIVGGPLPYVEDEVTNYIRNILVEGLIICRLDGMDPHTSVPSKPLVVHDVLVGLPERLHVLVFKGLGDETVVSLVRRCDPALRLDQVRQTQWVRTVRLDAWRLVHVGLQNL